MTAMPQMVALFNGVGGGAVALIAWVEYRHHFAVGPGLGVADKRRSRRCSPRSSARSRSGDRTSRSASSRRSSRAGRSSCPAPASRSSTPSLFVIAVGSAIVLAAGTHSQGLFILGILVAAAVLGNMIVLPIGGADMPVVISLLNAFTGLSAAATGYRAEQHRDDRRRHDRRRLGHDPHEPDGEGDEPLGAGDRRRRLRRRGGRAGGRRDRPRAGPLDHPRRTSRSSSPTPAWS